MISEHPRKPFFKPAHTDIVRDWREESQLMTYMTPREFLSLAYPLPGNRFWQPTLEKLKERLEFEQEIDVPWLDVDSKTCEVIGHEGRHRARAAEEVGLNKIPVVLFCRDPYKDKDGHTHYEYGEAAKCTRCLKKMKSESERESRRSSERIAKLERDAKAREARYSEILTKTRIERLRRRI